MKSIRERLWRLICILIGFYGNWYFYLLTKLEGVKDNLLWIFWLISSLSLFIYCVEIVHWKKTIIKNRIHLSVVLATIHLVAISGIIWVIGGWFSMIYQSGIVLWFLIASYEIKLHWLEFRKNYNN